MKKETLHSLEDQIKKIKSQLFKAEEILSRLLEENTLNNLDNRLKNE